MKILRIGLLCLLSTVATFAQTETLPDVLKPDPADEAEAAAMGAQVFKLVPFGKFKDKQNSYSDEDNPIGIRGGGAFYSFSSRSHSYNKTPDVMDYPGVLSTGMLASISFLADLGDGDISMLDNSSPEVQFFLSYTPPKLRGEVTPKRKRLSGQKVGRVTIDGSLRAFPRHVYLLRSITLERADIAVAIKILRIEPDGTMTIAWKALAEFPMPFVLEMPDKDLQQIVDDIIAKERYLGTRIVVKDGHLYSLGPSFAHDLDVENTLSRRGIHFRGAGGTMPQ